MQTQISPTTQDTVYQLAAQMMAAAASDADRARIDKALDLVEGVERMADRPDLFLVTSQTVADAAYRVHQGQCNCPDASRRDARRCKHAVAVALFQQLERLDAEQSDPTPDEAPPSCPLHGDEECDWGCPGPSLDPRTADVDPDARYALTGKGYLTLIHSAALPTPIGTIRRVPVVLSARAAQAASELYGDDYSGDVA